MNDSITMLEQSSDLQYQEKEVDLVGYKTTTIRTSLYEPANLHAVFKHELLRLIEIGVIGKAKSSKWIAGTFIVPKKDGHVHWITDFCGLNKSLHCKVYPLQLFPMAPN